MERVLIGDAGEVLIGRGLPRPLLPVRPERTAAAVLTQPAAAAIAEEVAARLSDEVAVTAVRVMPDGEAAKTLSSVGETYEWLAEQTLERGDTIVGVGGGALTDTAGFLAGTWQRGIEAVHVPTTLLGAVDASIGGKAGINLGGKNLVGVFWHPRRVIVDLDVLEALSEDLKRQGAAEIIKAGLLAGPGIVDAYRRKGLEVALAEVVPAAVRIKADMVNEDFTERGRRALLNLGHTIGHGIEFASGLSHGDSVAIGLVAAAAISERLLNFSDTELVLDALRAARLPLTAPRLDRDTVIRLIGRDKKRVAGRLRMVLLEAPGRPVLREVTTDDLLWGLERVGI